MFSKCIVFYLNQTDMKKNLLFLTVLFALTFGGCGIFDSDRIVEGEVFIVTRGGENIALGLIDIAIIESEDFFGILEESAAVYEKELDELQNTLQLRQEKIAELNELEKTNWAKVVAEGKTKTVRDYLPTRNYDYFDQISAQSSYDVSQFFINKDKERRRRVLYETKHLRFYRDELGFKTVDEYVRTLKEIDKQQELLIKDFNDINQFLKGESLVGNISSIHSSAKTNSQGQFNHVIKNNKDYYVVAKGSRLVGSEQEVYLWIIPLPKGKEDIRNFFLSNDNLTNVDEILGLLANNKL